MVKSINVEKDFVKIRSFLWGNVSNILDIIKQKKLAQKQDTEDLFGESGSSNVKMEWVKNVPQRPKLEILLEEKNSLGLYVSGNPLAEYTELLHWVRQTSSYDDIHLVLVEKIRKIFTRGGGMMLALQLTTCFDQLEGLVFPKNALRLSPLIEEKGIYWVFGNIKKRNNNSKDSPKKPVEPEKDLSEQVNEGAKIDISDAKAYDEAPKMMISELTTFAEGPLQLIKNAGLQISISREDILEKIEWPKFLLQPSLISNLSGKVTDSGQENNPTLEVEVQTIDLYFAKTIGLQKLAEIKAKLKNHYLPGGQKVRLNIETKDGWKQARGEFWIPQAEIKEFEKYRKN